MNAEQSAQVKKLYLDMHDKLVSYALSKFHDESQAEEAVQETFKIACRKPEDLLTSPNPPGWLMNVLKNVIRSTLRAREANRDLLSKYLLTMSQEITFTEDKINLAVLYENIADGEEFKIIYEMAVDGRTHLEMAQDRNISVSACKKRVQRAKEMLRSRIKL